MKLITKILINGSCVYFSNDKFFVTYYNRVVFSDTSKHFCVAVALNKQFLEKRFQEVSMFVETLKSEASITV